MLAIQYARRFFASAASSRRALTCLRSLTRGVVTSSETFRKTGLYDFHVEHGARMIPFEGYSMPLSYGSVSPIASHTYVRNSAGLFDLGHLLQSKFRGPTVTAFLEWLTPSSLAKLAPYNWTLSVLLNERGGIVDDIIITKHSDDAFYVVTNAGSRDKDLAWFRGKVAEWNASERAKAEPVEHEVLEGWGLAALQGPRAAQYLQGLTSFDLKGLTFGKTAYVSIEGFNLHVLRGGWTGEDGFEISIPPSQTVEVTRLLAKPPVQLAGVGAGNSLRLEAGLCMYGADIDENTTPVEAGLTWLIGKERREAGGFIGAARVLKHLKEGPPRRRVGLIVGGAPAEQGARVYAPSQKESIGTVTSGIESPTLGENIAMAYLKSGWHTQGTEVDVGVGDTLRKAVVTSPRFIKPNYWRG